MKATIEKQEGMIVARTPYNANFVADVKAIPGRKWMAVEKCWAVPEGEEDTLRQLVCKYFEVGDSKPVTEVIRIECGAKRSGPHTHGTPTVDGKALVNPWDGALARSDAFEVLQSASRVISRQHNNFEVEYALTLRVRVGATIEVERRNCRDGFVRIVE